MEVPDGRFEWEWACLDAAVGTTGKHCLSRTPTVALALVAVALSASSCGTVTDTYRRAAVVPNPYVPSRTGAPLKQGDIRLQGEVNSALLGGPIQPSSSSDSSPSLFLSHAEWLHTSPSTMAFNEWEDGGGTTNVKVDQEFFLRPVVSVQGGYQVHPMLNVFGIAAFELQERNRLQESYTHTVDSIYLPPDPTTTYPMGILGLGLELKVSKAFADIIAFYPLHGEKDLEFGPAASVLVGATL